MAIRRQMLFVGVLALSSMGASFQTKNFTVTAPNDQIAQQVGQYAEKYRKEKALLWLGKEMAPWGRPCPLKVEIKANPGGATTFAFDKGAIWDQEMNVQGPLERVLNSVLPHEITHTVFAYHFRCPLPRWADEGGSVLSEDDIERKRHDELVRQSLAGGRAFRLRVLFDMKQYPESGMDIMTLYAEGYSLVRFLVETTDRQEFLRFLGDGMKQGWDYAVRTHFAMNRVEDLEECWLKWLRGTYRPSEALLAKNAKAAAPASGGALAELTQPIVAGSASVVRGASPDETAPSQPTSWPRSNPAAPGRNDGWSPARDGGPRSPVKLLPIQPEP